MSHYIVLQVRGFPRCAASFEVLSVILREESESEVRKTMCERGCLKAKKAGTSEQNKILSPHNEEIFYCNFANPQAKL